jgi:two-component system sensor histidine kinase CpxA
MNTLIEEIIRLARLTDAPQSFRMDDDVDLGSLLDEVVEDVSAEAAVLGRRVVVAKPSSLIVNGNPELLRRAVENVLRNAVRYSREEAEITVQARREGGRVSVCIRDRGPGVPEADLQRIFDPFFRVSRARERDGGGTGLGLAITAQVMALHKGDVSADNHPEGGLVVTLTFPSGVAGGSVEPIENLSATAAVRELA